MRYCETEKRWISTVGECRKLGHFIDWKRKYEPDKKQYDAGNYQKNKENYHDYYEKTKEKYRKYYQKNKAKWKARNKTKKYREYQKKYQKEYYRKHKVKK